MRTSPTSWVRLQEIQQEMTPALNTSAHGRKSSASSRASSAPPPDAAGHRGHVGELLGGEAVDVLVQGIARTGSYTEALRPR